ncbi:MAG: ribonuclease/clavin/mitogillin [Candidatus Paceibacteria bacterium]|jgi:ribonuclease/clavin/mitogillin
MRSSSAVLMTRVLEGDLQVYLVERNPKLRFFGGYWAFPGGVLDAVDQLAEEVGDDHALERCALRELFEETGILCGALGLVVPESKRATLRESLVDLKTDASDWAPYAAAADEARSCLSHVTTISTPEFSPVRHVTPFFQVEIPTGQSPLIVPGELVQGRFWNLEQLVDDWRAGKISVAPPVLFLLDLMRGHSLEEFMRLAREHGERMAAGQLHQVYFTPGVMIAPLATPTLPPATTTNCVLVGEDRIYIVDPATPEARDRERLFETLDRWVAGGRTLAGILLTHHHMDHVGAVEVTAERYGLDLFAHPETLSLLNFPGVKSHPIEHGHQFDLGTAPDGSQGWTLEAFHTPGHAPGHLVFIESLHRAAIVGDLVSTLSTIVIDPPEGHMATYLASIQSILDQKISVLLPAHGAGARIGSDVLRYHLRRRAEREAKIVIALERAPGTLEELLPIVYDDAPAEVMPFAARSLLAGLQKLGEEQRATETDARWSLR